MNILSVDHAQFAVGHVALLDDTEFHLEQGERIGLIGRNGAGKSSFLKILAGVQQLDDGHLVCQSNLKVVYVPQESFFDDSANVFDVVAEGLGELRHHLHQYHQVSEALAHDGNNEDLLKQLNHLQIEIESRDGWQFDSLIVQTLAQLRVPENEIIGNLSGGQKKRVALAQAWVQKPDLLLLDEPTNHLDIEAIEWLEILLQNFQGSLVVVTHDRRFLDAIATRIVELDRGIMRSYPGTFSQYTEIKSQELAAEAEQNRLFDKFHAQEEVWIRKGIEARRTRNEGRVKRLEQLRRDRSSRRDVQGQVNFKLESGEKSGKIIAEMEHASFAFPDRTIMNDFSCVIQRGDKIGLIGPNGIGKTTFLKLILGDLEPTSGKVKLGSKQQVAYFDQFRSALNEEDTVFYTLGQGNDYVTLGNKSKHVMSYLEDFLFSPARAQSPVKSLSGGERNRLLLAKLFTQPANILVLDEPTNDLDIDTQELLEGLLQDYNGTVFLVSHDRMFIDNVITQSVVFEGDGVLKEYIGGYQDYQDAKAREQALLLQNQQMSKTNDSDSKKSAARNKSQRVVKLSFNEQRELEQLPQRLAGLEQEQADLNTFLLQTDVFKDHYQQAIDTQQRIGVIEESMLEQLERWEYLENKQNGAPQS